MFDLKFSTAINWPIFVHDVDGNPVTGKVSGDFTKRISQNGGAFGAMTVTVTEMEGGWYTLALTAAHTNTEGSLTVYLTAAGTMQINLQWEVKRDVVAQAGLAQAGASNQIQLDVTSWPPASASGEFYDGLSIMITSMLDASTAAVGQVRTIIAYNGTTKTATVDRDWDVQPVLGTGYIIFAGVGSTTLTLANIADAVLRRHAATARASITGDAPAYRSLLGVISRLTNKVQENAGFLDTMAEDDLTVFGHQAVTLDPSGVPISALGGGS